MTRTIAGASKGCASFTIDTGRAAQRYDAVRRKGRAASRSSLPAGPGELRKAPFFADVDEGTLSRLSADARIESLESGEYALHQGAGVTDLLFVVSGYVKLMRIAGSGSPNADRHCSAGEMIGEVPTAANEIHTVSAESIWAHEGAQPPAPRFARQLKECPSLCAALIAHSKESVARLVDEIESLRSQNADQRLAHFLSPIAGGRGPVPLSVCPMRRRLDRRALGVKQETLSRAFAKLRAHGVRTKTRTYIRKRLASRRPMRLSVARAGVQAS